MSKVLDLIQGVLDRHTSRKNAMSYGLGPECFCDECSALRKALKLLNAEAR